MAATRNVEQVTREIERERDQLAAAVSQLRGELRRATDVRAIVRERLPEIAAVALVGAGVVAAAYTFRRRRRRRHEEPEPAWRLRVGRLTLSGRA
ncbi:MAG TPA: hypothetical protein VH721_04880 [Gaiellaceae bacterium]|jgi:hypothetical protein